MERKGDGVYTIPSRLDGTIDCLSFRPSICIDSTETYAAASLRSIDESVHSEVIRIVKGRLAASIFTRQPLSFALDRDILAIIV